MQWTEIAFFGHVYGYTTLTLYFSELNYVTLVGVLQRWSHTLHLFEQKNNNNKISKNLNIVKYPYNVKADYSAVSKYSTFLNDT